MEKYHKIVYFSIKYLSNHNVLTHPSTSSYYHYSKVPQRDPRNLSDSLH